MSNTFGTILRLTTFGESHGIALGGVLDGFPAGIEINQDMVQRELARRRPGQSSLTTARREDDQVEFLSGIFEGKSLGTPIGFILRNEDAHSHDYDRLRTVFRPSHADYTWQEKYGIRDHRGGGRSSARETVARVVAGALARQALLSIGVQVAAYTSRIHTVEVKKAFNINELTNIDNYPTRCPDPVVNEEMVQAIRSAQLAGDTVGGEVVIMIHGLPAGLGEPVFDKLNAKLGAAMLSINATKYVEFGAGKAMTFHRGSEVLDSFICEHGSIRTATNFSGGIQGGISNGEDVYLRVGFKPVATLMQPVATVDQQGNKVELHVQGRHDPCVVPRAVPITEAMAALVVLDHYLLAKTTHM